MENLHPAISSDPTETKQTDQSEQSSLPREANAGEQSSDYSTQECSVLCVDIDDSMNTSATSGASGKDATAVSDEAVHEEEEEEEEAGGGGGGDTGSESKNDETSSWHPSDDDDDGDHDAGGSRSRRSRRTTTQSEAQSMSAAQRRRRTRKRLFCHSDSSASSSPSRVTRANKRTHPQTTNPDSDVVNGTGSNQEKDAASGSDDYCWICHKVGQVRPQQLEQPTTSEDLHTTNQMVICSCCPRVYHPMCLCMSQFPETWLCPECQDLLVAECALYQLPAWKDITPNQLQDMLLFLIDRLATQQWAQDFREPVDTEIVEGYADLISYPMDLHTLYQRILRGTYASTQAFLGDFRWILHNCVIFNGVSSPLTSCARLLDQACTRELALMRACPKCYINRMPAIHLLPSTAKTLPLLTKKEWSRSVPLASDSSESEKKDELKISDSSPSDPWWFCQLCDVLHPLVWVRLEYYPRWPAKVMAVDTKDILVVFFGDYDVTMAPLGSARVHSDSRAGRSPFLNTNATGSECQTLAEPATPPRASGVTCSVNKGNRNVPRSSTHLTVDASYKQALVELDYHLSRIKERCPTFRLPNTPIEFTRNYYTQFRKTYGPISAKSKAETTKSATPPTSALSSATVVTSVDQTLPPASQNSTSTSSRIPEDNFEPVLSRAATGFLTSLSCSKVDRMKSGKNVRTRTANTGDSLSSGPAQLSSSANLVMLKVDACESSNVEEIPPPPDTKDESDHPPTVLQPIPAIGHDDEPDGVDEIRALLERMRNQFQESLQCLEEKWQLTRSNDERKNSIARDPPLLSAATVETEVQTDTEPKSKRSRGSYCETSTSVMPDLMDASTITKHVASPLTPIQAVMMESEITRLERENQRLNLLLAFTRAEMAFEMRQRIAELRRVWNFEVTAVLEAASSIWEQDLVRIVDAVKRKQWCAYCGRVAFYYCCWNTCYCNSACQAKHWASHITSCVQARSQQASAEASSTVTVPTPTIGISPLQGNVTSVALDKSDRTHHHPHLHMQQPQQTMVAWPAVPVHSVASVPGQPGGMVCRAMNSMVRGKLNP